MKYETMKLFMHSEVGRNEWLLETNLENWKMLS